MNYAHSVNENLVCPICKQPFMDAVTLKPCSHTFCRACVSGLIACPMDRLPFHSVIQADRIIRNLCDELIVTCPPPTESASGSGECGWTGARHLLQAHLLECPLRLLPAPVKSGDQILVAHLEQEVSKLRQENARLTISVESMRQDLDRLLLLVSLSDDSQLLQTRNIPQHPPPVSDAEILREEVQRLQAVASQQSMIYPEIAHLRVQMDRLMMIMSQYHLHQSGNDSSNRRANSSSSNNANANGSGGAVNATSGSQTNISRQKL
eukprot:Partr_v1_DN26849_c0_g2_i1_m40211